MNCPHCQSQVKEGALFCQECGHRLNIRPAAPSPVQAGSPERVSAGKDRSSGSGCLASLVIGAGLIVMLCAFASIGLYLAKGEEIKAALSKLSGSRGTPLVIEIPTDQPSPTPRGLPVGTDPPSTSTSPMTPSGLTTSQPPTSAVMPTDTPSPQKESFVEDFSSNQGWEIASTDRYSLGIAEGGIYRMDFWIAGDTDWVIALQPKSFTGPLRDMHVAVTASGMNDAGAYGLVCRCTDHDNLYGLHIANDGRYWIFKMVEGKGTTLASNARSEIKGDMHRIEMWCVGETIRAVVDGMTLEEIQDTSLSVGNAGLFAQPLGGGLEGPWSFYAYFDDFSMEIFP